MNTCKRVPSRRRALRIAVLLTAGPLVFLARPLIAAKEPAAPAARQAGPRTAGDQLRPDRPGADRQVVVCRCARPGQGG